MNDESQYMTVWIDKRLVTQADLLSALYGTSRSQIVRIALKNFLAQQSEGLLQVAVQAEERLQPVNA